MSLLLLHATKMRAPSTDGCTHVGEQLTSPAFGGSMPCPAMSCEAWSELFPGGAPCTPRSFPLPTRKCLATVKARVSISTAMSSIMHAEYCFVPCALMRDPWGIVQVGTRATSTISPVATIETLDGTISPWRLKLTT